jgi:predicted DNA-binding transcriptional regulator AlpA
MTTQTAVNTYDPEMIGPPVATLMTGLSLDTLRRLWKRGAFVRPVKVCKALRWRRSDVQEWVDARVQQAQQQPESAKEVKSGKRRRSCVTDGTS